MEMCLFDMIITARKLSLGQGNIFTSVCHSVHRGWYPSMHCSGGCAIPACLAAGGAWWRPPPGRLLLRAVRILLECILVLLISLHGLSSLACFRPVTNCLGVE